MRRRPMQAWPVRDRATLGPRGKRVSWSTALAVCALVAVVMPCSAAAATPSISFSVDGIAGNNGWWRGSTHGNNVVVHWTVTASPDLTNSKGCDPAITIPGPTAGVTLTCTATNDEGTSSSSRTIKIDADPPTVSKVAVTSRTASELVRWTSTSTADSAIIQRSARGTTKQQVVFDGAASRFVDKKI